MKGRGLSLVVVGASLLGAAGCANVTSAMGASTQATGEAWYVKTTTFFSIPTKSRVYYCPPSKAAAVECTEAELRR